MLNISGVFNLKVFKFVIFVSYFVDIHWPNTNRAKMIGGVTFTMREKSAIQVFVHNLIGHIYLNFS